MTFSLAGADRDTAALRDFEGADLASLPRGELLALLRVASAFKGSVDRLVAEVAGEVARRSTADDGAGGLARQQGFASPELLVASTLGAAPNEGAKLVRAGAALASGGALGTGLREQGLTVGKADLISQAIAGLAGDTSELEARLVQGARVLDYRQLKLLCAREAAKFDALQLEGRERRQYDQRGIDFTEDALGMTHVRGQLPPEYAAAVKTYFDAQVKAAFHARREQAGDDRTATQIRADALMALATHGLDCNSPASGVKATIIVRIDRDQLERDVGVATCDALATPISLRALRQLAVDATVLPVVMNGKSEVLDQGREQRLFSWQQRMALAERDGGCAQCHAPISHCITHHIRWWSRDGLTDLRNGVLLCTRCHTQLHADKWEIEVDAENRVWFIAPAQIDPGRRRSLGGLAALSVGA